MRALVTGALGQDGSYLCEHLLYLGYQVFGLVRRSAEVSSAIAEKVTWIYGDLRDELSLEAAIRKSWPDEVYNLAGQVYVPASWAMPAETFDVNTGGLARILKILLAIKKDTKVYQASTSEMFGSHDGPCNESTPLCPQSPYGISKVAAHNLIKLYRDRDMYVVSGILFNHESPRRGHEMVTRKIARQVARWAAGNDDMLHLGSIISRRDWGFAGEYVQVMHKMLQQPEPEDFVIGTGEAHSVEEFLFAACDYAGVGRGFAEGHLMCDPRMMRPQDIFDMRADATKAREKLGWQPQVDFETLVGMMVGAELATNVKFVEESAT